MSGGTNVVRSNSLSSLLLIGRSDAGVRSVSLTNRVESSCSSSVNVGKRDTVTLM